MFVARCGIRTVGLWERSPFESVLVSKESINIPLIAGGLEEVLDFLLLWRTKKNNAAKIAIVPPMTPPTIAPTLVWELSNFRQ